MFMIALLPVGARSVRMRTWPRVLTTRRRIGLWQEGPAEIGPGRTMWFQLCNGRGGTWFGVGDAWEPSLTRIAS